MMNVAIRPLQSASSSQPKYYSHQPRGQISPSNVGYGDSQGRTPTFVQAVGRTAGKLPAQGKVVLIVELETSDWSQI